MVRQVQGHLNRLLLHQLQNKMSKNIRPYTPHWKVSPRHCRLSQPPSPPIGKCHLGTVDCLHSISLETIYSAKVALSNGGVETIYSA